ncbi:hypothetical protein Bca4012_060889 [Brassica carinata]
MPKNYCAIMKGISFFIPDIVTSKLDKLTEVGELYKELLAKGIFPDTIHLITQGSMLLFKTYTLNSHRWML